MNLRNISRFLGAILLVIGAAMGLCLLVDFASIQWGSGENDLKGNLWSMMITVTFGVILYAIGHRTRGEPLLRKEAVAVTSLSWLTAATFGSLPYIFSQNRFPPIQAFFESMSGFTTTGSTIVPALGELSPSLMFWRSLTSWVGGLGILALLVALMAALGTNSKSLLGSESSLNLRESPTARVRALASRLWVAYSVLTLVCVSGLFLVGKATGEEEMGLFNALLYTMTTVSTGGFAPHDASVGHFDNPWIEAYLIVFMMISSFSLFVVINTLAFQTRLTAGRAESIALVVLVVVASAAVTGNLVHATDLSVGEAIREAVFPVVSTSTSTGYGTSDYDQWPLFSQWVILIVMLVGGCSGSTSGGLKVIRLLILSKVVYHEVVRSFRPNVVPTYKIAGQPIDQGTRLAVMAFLVLAAVIILISSLILSLVDPALHDFQSTIGAVIGTFMNIGPGLGDVGPTDNFAGLNDFSLLYTAGLMLLGRLEIFAVLALFTGSLWRRY